MSSKSSKRVFTRATKKKRSSKKSIHGSSKAELYFKFQIWNVKLYQQSWFQRNLSYLSRTHQPTSTRGAQTVWKLLEFFKLKSYQLYRPLIVDLPQEEWRIIELKSWSTNLLKKKTLGILTAGRKIWGTAHLGDHKRLYLYPYGTPQRHLRFLQEPLKRELKFRFCGISMRGPIFFWRSWTNWPSWRCSWSVAILGSSPFAMAESGISPSDLIEALKRRHLLISNLNLPREFCEQLHLVESINHLEIRIPKNFDFDCLFKFRGESEFIKTIQKASN